MKLKEIKKRGKTNETKIEKYEIHTDLIQEIKKFFTSAQNCTLKAQPLNNSFVKAKLFKEAMFFVIIFTYLR